MILVTGATGLLGTAVVDRLLQRTDPTAVAALVRNPSKAGDLEARGVSIRLGDYDDTDALQRAMDSVERVLLIAGTDPQRRVQQHQNVIDAAGRAGVALIGFASRSLRDVHGSKNALMSHYFETEDRIRRSGLAHLLFRNALYMDTVPGYLGGAQVFATGASASPPEAAESPTPYAGRWVRLSPTPCSTTRARIGPMSSRRPGPTASTT